MINRKVLSVVIFLLLGGLPFLAGARDNPFVLDNPPPKQELRLPTVASRVMAKIMIWQHRLNTKLTEHVKRLQETRSFTTLLPLVLVSFLYGVIHAAGPGHGKVVVFSYFLSRRSTIKEGLLLGNLISLFHALSGILIVLTLSFIIRAAYLASLEALSGKVKMVSYSLVVLIGITLLVGSIVGIIRHPPKPPEDEHSMERLRGSSGVLPLALAVGMVPCPGVVIIMLFALSFNLLAIGLALSFTMAFGMACTISLAGLLSILGQETLLKGLARREKVRYLVQKGLTIFGSLLITGFGTLLLIGTL